MKKFISLILSIAVLFCICGCSKNNNSLIRIHIRANSNEQVDQQVKYKVKNEVVHFLDPKLIKVTSFDKAFSIIQDNLSNIEKICDKVLLKEGYNYSSRAKLNNEYFPTRSYEGIVVESGYYDALIIELGSGKGDNWWCVIYPPLCFISTSTNSEFTYKSLIKQIWEKFISRKG